MGDKSKIEWTDATWNPVRGCSKVSEGCANCYAERMAARFCKNGEAYHRTIADGRWTGELRFDKDALKAPLRWRKPRRIFVCSMSDLFHPSVPHEFQALVFGVILGSPQHIFQILTKRPEAMKRFVDGLGGAPKNAWLGVTAENQARADERIPVLLKTPAAVRFVSCEPLLGPIDLEPFFDPVGSYCCGGEPEFCRCLDGWQRTSDGHSYANPDWVIAGGESGPGARPMHPDWTRSLRDQCQSAGVPFLFKQWGEWVPERHPEAWTPDPFLRYEEGVYDWNEFGADGEYNTYSCRVGKKRAGRLLDGRTWDQFPSLGRS